MIKLGFSVSVCSCLFVFCLLVCLSLVCLVVAHLLFVVCLLSSFICYTDAMEAPRSRLIKGAFILFLLIIALIVVSILTEQTADRKQLANERELARRVAAERAAGYVTPTD